MLLLLLCFLCPFLQIRWRKKKDIQRVSITSAVTVQDYYKQGVELLSSIIVADIIPALSDAVRALESFTVSYSIGVVLVTLFLLLTVRCACLGRNRQKLSDYNKDDSLLPTLCDLAKTAFTSGQTDRVIHMVETQDVDVNTHLSYHGLNLFLCSCLSGNRRLVQYMLSKGGDVRRTTSAGDSSLYLATFSVINSRQPDCSVLEDIILAGCDVNTPNSGGYTPLHRAAGGGQLQIIKLFLKYGANPHTYSAEGIYPVDIAINNGHLEAAELLQIRAYNPHVWDVIDPHTPPHIKLGLQSPKRNHLIESSRQYCSPKLKAIR